MTWTIERVSGAELCLDEVTALYRSSGLGDRRPIADRDRFAAMVRNANLILTCRQAGELIGIARSVSDFAYVTYLSDMAVARGNQRSGVGRALIDATQAVAPSAKIVLLAAPNARDYYPHIGFAMHGSAWVLDAGRATNGGEPR